MKHGTHRLISVRTRTTFALAILIFIQVLVLFGALWASETLTFLDQYSIRTLTSQVNSRVRELNASLQVRIEGSQHMAQSVSDTLQGQMARRGLNAATLKTDPDAVREMLFAGGDILIEYLRYIPVTGVYIILDASTTGADLAHSAVYLRDFSPGMTTANDINAQLRYGPVDFARSNSIALHSLWNYDFLMSENADSSAFYYNTIEAAKNAATGNFLSLAYASPPTEIGNDGIMVTMYSYPLLDENNDPYGIVGFELSEDYIATLLPFMEIALNNGFYSIWVDDGGGYLTKNCISSGAMAKQFMPRGSNEVSMEELSSSKDSVTGYVWTSESPDRNMMAAIVPLRMYSGDSVFASTNRWYLSGIVPTVSIRAASRRVMQSMMISAAVLFAMGIVLMVIISRYISRPIVDLAKEVVGLDPELPVKLKKIGVLEVDSLSGSLEALSDNVSAAAARLSRIVELVDMPIGGFEINHTTQKMFLTDSMFRLTGLEQGVGPFIELSKWNSFIDSLTKISAVNINAVSEVIWQRQNGSGMSWYRIKSAYENRRTYGLLIDITDEMIQKQRMVYERSYDQLTRLLNRQAFLIRANAAITEQPGKVGLMMFGDLDNLKSINDAYGHDIGDLYIQKAAEALLVFKEIGGLVARISGDEFVVFIHGFDSIEVARSAFENKARNLKNATLTTIDGMVHKVRISLGVSYYPKDSASIEELIKYSDFAMFEIKRTMKGELREFEASSYDRNSFLLQKKALLDIFIDEARLEFHFQPIVDARTGEIFAYEALMRPKMREFKTPFEVLQIARSQAKLNQIERMTFFGVYKWIAGHFEELKRRKVFLNSIPGHTLKPDDMSLLQQKYHHYMDQTVVEVTEDEYAEIESTTEKISVLRGFNIEIAIDDYGAGYSNDLVLLNVIPDYIKIDMSLVRDIDKDPDRHALVQNSISYASSRGIKVIAEGVETYAEMKALCSLGVDYLQGYYLCRPQDNIMELSEEQKAEIQALKVKTKASTSSKPGRGKKRSVD